MTDEVVQDVYKIRPAARLIHTIGSDLIGDSYAALVELVKNAYDADAVNVYINFEYKDIEDKPTLIISIEDDGHGMSFDTVINKWLVPATNDKLNRKESPVKKRPLQGRKGIGRFAASILGQELTLNSVAEDGEDSTVVIDWRIFNSNEFLENIEILVERKSTNKKSGTYIEIFARDEPDDSKISVWDKEAINRLINELRKLISPFKNFEEDKFNINLSFTDCPIEEFNEKAFEIETYPIIELYDYRIHGIIDRKGNAKLVYENNVSKAKQVEEIKTYYILEDGGKYCGDLILDFRVFDREPEAIDNLINKGLIDPISEKYAGKNQARAMLNEVYGVNIYKNFFRIRPYGNGGIDWLDLDKDRIQNFSLKISNNQVVGFITIQSEELSHLEEKSARDGLKENEYYLGLKELCKKTLKELELRRFTYRERSLKSRKGRTTIQDSVQNLFSFSDLSNNIEAKLHQFNVGNANIEQIKKILKDEEISKNEVLEDIQKTIAIYQSQATLGKIVSFIVHEGRKPIQFLNTETNVLERYIKFYKATQKEEYLLEINESIEGFRRNSRLIAELFKRINPLAIQKRGSRREFKVLDVLTNATQIFKETLRELKISIEIKCNSSILINGWEEDLFTALTNLLENSIYWLSKMEKEDKEISLEAAKTEDAIIIDYKDNGPGLSENEIETDIIFEPGYSKKHNGTGLGLAIAGEAIQRLGGKLIARKSDKGAYFQIEIQNK